jgi:hypothetical protein
VGGGSSSGGGAGGGSSANKPAVRPASPVFIDWLATRNPWMTDNGVPAQTYEVTRLEYQHYLDQLPETERAWAQPLFHAAADGEGAGINWITFEQAERYCAALGAKLITSEQWDRTDAARSGINPGGYRTWTSTKLPDGKAVVRGAFAQMPPDKIKAEAPWRTQHDTEATAGGRDSIEKVASNEISFRCAR